MSNPIIAAVEASFGVPGGTIQSASRDARHVRARQAAALLLRTNGASYGQIGTMLGRHHTSIMHAIEMAAKRRNGEVDFASRVEAAEKAVAARKAAEFRPAHPEAPPAPSRQCAPLSDPLAPYRRNGEPIEYAIDRKMVAEGDAKLREIIRGWAR